jgi:hypothetical protein
MHYAIALFQHIRFLKTYPPFQAYLKSNDSLEMPYPGFEHHKNEFNSGLYSLQLLIGEREREKPAYWQRAWITQEVISAKRLILQSGSAIISEGDIELVTEFISSPKVSLLMGGRYEERKSRAFFRSSTFIPISVYRSLLHQDQAGVGNGTARMRGPLQLLSLLKHNRSRHCSDARDKIYSILSISGLANSGLSVDYRKSISDVYTETVQAMIQSSSSLEVLCSANLAETSSLPGLPSWVPNWSIYKSPETCERPVSYNRQQATGNVPAKVSFDTEGNIKILSAKGFSFGYISGSKTPLCASI